MQSGNEYSRSRRVGAAPEPRRSRVGGSGRGLRRSTTPREEIRWRPEWRGAARCGEVRRAVAQLPSERHDRHMKAYSAPPPADRKDRPYSFETYGTCRRRCISKLNGAVPARPPTRPTDRGRESRQRVGVQRWDWFSPAPAPRQREMNTSECLCLLCMSSVRGDTYE